MNKIFGKNFLLILKFSFLTKNPSFWRRDGFKAKKMSGKKGKDKRRWKHLCLLSRYKSSIHAKGVPRSAVYARVCRLVTCNILWCSLKKNLILHSISFLCFFSTLFSKWVITFFKEFFSYFFLFAPMKELMRHCTQQFARINFIRQR